MLRLSRTPCYDRMQLLKILFMQFSPVSCDILSLRPKYLRQYPDIIHPHRMFLRSYERPGFTSMSNRQNNMLHHILFFTSFDEKLRQARWPLVVGILEFTLLCTHLWGFGCYCRSSIFLSCHIFIGLVSCRHILTLSCILYARHE